MMQPGDDAVQTTQSPEGAGAPAVEALGIVKEYPAVRGAGVALRVLDGIDLRLEAGQSLAVMGPSGSGKSTLLHILGTLDQPTSGRLRLAGAEPAGLNDAALAQLRNRAVGFVFQDHQLLPHCTALENVLVPALVRPAAERAAAAGRAAQLLARVGLEERLDYRPAELSGGERQRVAIARALINRPALLLCDEPTGNLDEDNARAVAECFGELQRAESVALVVVTHNPAFAARFDRRCELRHGRLIPVG